MDISAFKHPGIKNVYIIWSIDDNGNHVGGVNLEVRGAAAARNRARKLASEAAMYHGRKVSAYFDGAEIGTYGPRGGRIKALRNPYRRPSSRPATARGTCKLGKRAVACPTRGKKAGGRRTTRMGMTTFTRGKTTRQAVRVGTGYLRLGGEDTITLRPSNEALAQRLGLNYAHGTLVAQKRSRALRARVLRIVQRKVGNSPVRWLDANGRRATLD